MSLSIIYKALAIALIGASAVSANTAPHATGTGVSPHPTAAAPAPHYPFHNGTAPAAVGTGAAPSFTTSVIVETLKTTKATPAPTEKAPVPVGTGKTPAPIAGTGAAPAASGTGVATPYPTFATSGASSIKAAGLGLVVVAMGAMLL